MAVTLVSGSGSGPGEEDLWINHCEPFETEQALGECQLLFARTSSQVSLVKSSAGCSTTWRWNRWLRQPRLWWRPWATPKPRLPAPPTWTTSGQCSKWVYGEVKTRLNLIVELISQKLASEFIVVKRLGRGKAMSSVCFWSNYCKSFLEARGVAGDASAQATQLEQVV